MDDDFAVYGVRPEIRADILAFVRAFRAEGEWRVYRVSDNSRILPTDLTHLTEEPART